MGGKGTLTDFVIGKLQKYYTVASHITNIVGTERLFVCGIVRNMLVIK